MAEYDVQWVGEADWIFKTTFSTTAAELALPFHDLVFEGLDTFCRVELVSLPPPSSTASRKLARPCVLLSCRTENNSSSRTTCSSLTASPSTRSCSRRPESPTSSSFTLSLLGREGRKRRPRTAGSWVSVCPRAASSFCRFRFCSTHLTVTSANPGNGDSSRLYVRKAQYGYGWDWGLVLMSVGPWKNVFLEHFTTRISDVRVDSDVAENLSTSVDISVT